MTISIKKCLIASAILLFAFLCAQGVLSLVKLDSVHDSMVDLTRNRLAAIDLLGDIDAQTTRYRLRAIRFAAHPDAGKLPEIEAQLRLSAIRIDDLLARYQVRLTAAGASGRWQAFLQAWQDYLPDQEAAIRARRAGDRDGAILLLEDARDKFLAATAAIRSEIARNTMIADDSMRVAGDIYANARKEVMILTILGLIVGLGVAAYVLVYVTRPMRAYSLAMRSIAAGKLDTAVPGTERTDEIGELARTLVHLREMLQEADTLRAEQAVLDAANLKAIAEAQTAELTLVKDSETMLADIAEELDRQVEEKTRHLLEREREIVWRLSRATERRDTDTGVHIVRMGRISGLIAEALGMSEPDCRMLEIAAQMHDIGKVGIPDEILFKPGRLTPEERAVMETHALLGWEILRGSDSPLIQLAAEIAASHHERWDGTGYPKGLAGEAIPLGGRICALADVFDALMAARPYKEAWSLDKTIAFIEENSGRHFDPNCVAALLSRLDDVVAILKEHADTHGAVEVA